MGTVRHKFVYSNYQSFRTPGSAGITVLERCSRTHGTYDGTYECSMLRVTTYAELRGWLR